QHPTHITPTSSPYTPPPPPHTYTLSLHDALPIYHARSDLVNLYGVAIHQPRGLARDPEQLPLHGRLRGLSLASGFQPGGAGLDEIGRAHVRTPVTSLSRMPSSA